MDLNSEVFKKYVKHVLKWEGLTSKDPDDTQATCAPFAGAYHTNKGVTYCTFKKYANQLGITPVNYERFLKLSDSDIAKFVYHFMQKAEASPLQTTVALSVTEAAWMSGPVRAVEHLQVALNKLGNKIKVDGDVGPSTLAAAKKIDEKTLYNEYWKERKRYLDYLTSQPKWKKWKNGWNNRMNDFFKVIPASVAIVAAAGSGAALLILAAVFF